MKVRLQWPVRIERKGKSLGWRMAGPAVVPCPCDLCSPYHALFNTFQENKRAR